MSGCQLSVANLLSSAGLFCFKLQWLNSSMSWPGQQFHLSPILLRLEGWSEQFLLMTNSSLWCSRVSRNMQGLLRGLGTDTLSLSLTCHWPKQIMWAKAKAKSRGDLPRMRPYQRWGFREEWRIEVSHSIFHTIVQDPTKFLHPPQSLLLVFPSTGLLPSVDMCWDAIPSEMTSTQKSS